MVRRYVLASISFLVFLLNFTPSLAQSDGLVVGSWDAAFGSPGEGGLGFPAATEALALDPSSGTVYAGGQRLAFEEKVVAWNGNNWQSIGGDFDDAVLALAVSPDGTLYAGGEFTNNGGSTFAGIARYNGSSWQPLGQGVEGGSVRALAVDPSTGDVYAGGDFDLVVQTDGTPVVSPKIARWTGSQWVRVGYGADGVGAAGVNAIAFDPVSGDLFVGGRLNGMRNDDSTRVDVGDVGRFDGTTWTAVEDDSELPLTRVNDLAFDDAGNLYVGHEADGGFAVWDRSMWSVPANGTGVFDRNGRSTDDDVHSLLVAEDRVYVGGGFDFVQQTDGTALHAPGVAVYRPSMNRWFALGEGVNQPSTAGHVVLDLGTADSRLFAAGRFTEAGARPSANFGIWSEAPQDFPGTEVTFRADFRQAMRLGLLDGLLAQYPTSYRPMVDVLSGSSAGRYFLYDADGDSIWTARVPQPSGTSIDHAYVIDVGGDGYNDQDDWVYEREAPQGEARSRALTNATLQTLPVEAFDDLTRGSVDQDYAWDDLNMFRSGNPSQGRFRGANDQPQVIIDPEALDRTMNVAMRWYTKAAGGSAPAGIAVVSKNAYWSVAVAPRAAVFSTLVEFEYGPIPGIGEPNDLRLLYRSDAGRPWTIVDADIDVTDEVLRAEGVRDLFGEWTFGSVSTANPLTSDPPRAAANPTPSDGDLSAPVRPLLRWSDSPDAQAYDVYLWNQNDPEPGQPIVKDLDVTAYQAADDLLFGDTYYWRVVAKNINGETTGPAWSFTVGSVPDLTVTAIDVSSEAFSGQPIEINWTVENAGDGGTNAPVWYDQVFVSSEAAFDLESAESIGSFKNVSFLNPGESYANSKTVTLPNGIEGTQYVFVMADAGDPMRGGARDQLEEANESNNATSIAVDVTLAPFADLQVESVIVPSNVFSGDSVDVQYTVRNAGTGRTDSTRWFDSIFLSGDDVFDVAFSTHAEGELRLFDPKLDAFEHTGALEPGSSYTATARVKLPDEAIGDLTLFVYADINPTGERVLQYGLVYEYNVELNNWTGKSFSSTLTPPPDLVVTDITPPASAESGQTAELQWTVANEGPGTTRLDRWRDVVYFSPTAEFDSTTAVLLGGFRHDGALAPDESYTTSEKIHIPDGYEGAAYFFVTADGEARVFEYTFEDNNRGSSTGSAQVAVGPYPDLQISEVAAGPAQAAAGEEIALTYTVANTGNAVAGSPWVDSVYVLTSPTWDPGAAPAVMGVEQEGGLEAGASRSETVALPIPKDAKGTVYVYAAADGSNRVYEYPDTEKNEGRSNALSIDGSPAADLAVSISDVPEDAQTGEPLALTITIENAGTGRTPASGWMDEVFLSLNDTYESDVDHFLRQVLHDGRLDAGARYTINEVPIPKDRPGDWFLIVRSDADQNVVEADEANNLAVAPLTITLTDPADLHVSTVEAPEAVQGGQPATVGWTVTNDGTGSTHSKAQNGGWFDAVFLSPDGKLDRNDVLLGTREHTGDLDGGGSYAETMEVSVPAFASGPYVFLVQTDRRDDVYEHQAEGNNVTTSRTDLTLPAPSDLVVSSITAPEQAVPGEPVTVSWTLTNQGDNPASGFMREAVFVSDDDEWDVDDPILGVLEREIDLAPGSSMEASMQVDMQRTYRLDEAGEVTEALPGVPPGAYYAVVRTDIANTIRETEDANNAAASDQTMQVEVPLLEPGVEETLSLGSGESRYYRLETKADQDIRIRLTSDDAEAANEIYAAFERTPDAGGDADYAAAEPFTSDQTLVLPATEAGTYFLQIIARDVSDADETVTVLAEVLGFELTSVSPHAAGQGQITTSLTGGGFRPTDTVFLRGDDGASFEGEVLPGRTSTDMQVRYHLDDTPAGTYDVVVQRTGGDEEAVLPGAFAVEDALPLTVATDEISPDAFRAQASAELAFIFTNTGNVDVPYLEAQLQIVDALDLEVQTSDGLSSRTDFIRRQREADGQDAGGDVGFQDFILGSDGLYVVPLIARDLVPGASVRALLRTGTGRHREVQYSSWTAVYTREEFLTDVVRDIEEERLGILENPGDYGLESVALASDPERFRDDRIQRLVASGLLSSAALETVIDDVETVAKLEVNARKGPVNSVSAGDNRGNVGQEADMSYYDQTAASDGGAACTSPDTLSGNWPPTEEDKCLCRKLGASAIFNSSAACGNQHAACGCFRDIHSHCYNPEEENERQSVNPDTGEKETYDKDCRKQIDSCKEAARDMRKTDSSTPLSPEGCNCRPIFEPCDPNDISGPKGSGDEDWVSVQQTLPYAIHFENDSTRATAPAQVVRITHPLDADVDARSFRLGDFGFGSFEFSPPENVAHLRERLDVRDSLGVFVDVTAGVDVLSREAFWMFSSVSPETGDQPRDDPFAGFLPINNASGDGEGFVKYTVRPNPDARTGDVIEAAASIVFDMNAPIETPVVKNTVDADPPTSRMKAQPWKRDTVAFSLDWEGSDMGSGLSTYAVYVSRDDGPFELYADNLTETSLLFVGDQDADYRYFSRATDNAGNREPLKTEGETGVLVPVEETKREVPDEFALYQNYPNPFNPSTTIPFDLPKMAEVEVVLYNVLGRRVATLERTELDAGRHTVRVNLSQLASGVYFYAIQATAVGGAKYRDVKKLVLVK